MSSTGFLAKAVDLAVRRNSGAVRGCGSRMNKVRSAVTGQVLSCVAAKMISTPVWLTSVLLRLSRRIACWSPSENVISDRVSLVSANVRAWDSASV